MCNEQRYSRTVGRATVLQWESIECFWLRQIVILCRGCIKSNWIWVKMEHGYAEHVKSNWPSLTNGASLRSCTNHREYSVVRTARGVFLFHLHAGSYFTTRQKYVKQGFLLRNTITIAVSRVSGNGSEEQALVLSNESKSKIILCHVAPQMLCWVHFSKTVSSLRKIVCSAEPYFDRLQCEDGDFYSKTFSAMASKLQLRAFAGAAWNFCREVKFSQPLQHLVLENLYFSILSYFPLQALSLVPYMRPIRHDEYLAYPVREPIFC